MKVRADEVKRALEKKHGDDFFLTEVKNGPTQSVKNHFKLDAMAIKRSWANPAIIGYEVKVSRSDFQRDDKWPAYLALCNQFSFVCPKGLIQLEELPPEVGLIYYNPETRSLTTKRKALYRLIDEPIDMYKYIIMSRLDSDRHPFFSNARDYFEQYVLDKSARKSLGAYVARKLQDDYTELRIAFERQQRAAEHYQEDGELLKKVADVLREYGINVSRWSDWEKGIRQAMGSKINPSAVKELSRLTAAAAALEKLIQIDIREEQ